MPNDEDAARSVQRLLNRAVRTSCADQKFMSEARRLAAEHPHTLLLRSAASASVNEVQAELLCSILASVPELSLFCASEQAERMLCDWLHELLATPLHATRQRAVLLMLARLTQPLPQLSPDQEIGAEHISASTGMIEDTAHSPQSSGDPLLSRCALLERVLVPLLVSPSYRLLPWC